MSTSVRRATLMILVYATLFVGLVAVLNPGVLLWVSPAWAFFPLGNLRWLALVLFIPGALLAGWCALSFALVGLGTPAPFDPPKKLVVRGPYLVVRNPMYLGLLLILAAEVVWFSSWALLLYVILVSIALHHVVVRYEELALKASFGEEFEQYAATVPRWLPRLWR